MLLPFPSEGPASAVTVELACFYHLSGTTACARRVCSRLVGSLWRRLLVMVGLQRFLPSLSKDNRYLKEIGKNRQKMGNIVHSVGSTCLVGCGANTTDPVSIYVKCSSPLSTKEFGPIEILYLIIFSLSPSSTAF